MIYQYHLCQSGGTSTYKDIPNVIDIGWTVLIIIKSFYNNNPKLNGLTSNAQGTIIVDKQ